MNYDDNDIKSINNYAKRIEKSSLRESTKNCYSVGGGNKGQLGQLVEKYYFGYDLNSKQEADFGKVGVELKVCPLKEINKQKSSPYLVKRLGLSAKERIVLTLIDYFKLAEEEWDEATVLKKINLLLMFYLYNKDVEIDEQIFYLVSLWSPSEEDMAVIKEDWELIRNKVRNGRAHEISEGDTMYLGACTKGSSKNSKRNQPKSNLLAMQRAFSLKRSYVDFIVEELLQNRESVKKTSQIRASKDITFSERLLIKINENTDVSVKELIQKYKLSRERKAKNYLQLITFDYLKAVYGKSIKEIEQFNKAGIEIKCILLQVNGVPKESMSFEQIQYIDIINEEWYGSSIRDKFENKKHLWIVYIATRKYNKQSELELDEIVLQQAFFWNMPIKDLDEDYYVLWKDTVEKIRNGKYDDFMKSKDNRVGHIRPKGRNNDDVMLTFQGTYERKKCFWLNAKYIANEINKNNKSR